MKNWYHITIDGTTVMLKLNERELRALRKLEKRWNFIAGSMSIEEDVDL